MEPAASEASSKLHWWSLRQVPKSHTLHCRLGPLDLKVCHDAGEWRLAWAERTESASDVAHSFTLEPSILQAGKMERHVFADGTDALRLRPKLLDKPVVVRPSQPIFLPPGESTVLYLSSPLCVSIEVSDPLVELREVAMLRLSDTWFGPNTREGELAYADRTHARHHFDSIQRRPHRTITPVRIENRSADTLPLQKLSLPVPALSVYGAADGSLWTQTLTLVRSVSTDQANMSVGNPPEDLVGPLELLSPPRKPAQRGGLIRAFGLIFGH